MRGKNYRPQQCGCAGGDPRIVILKISADFDMNPQLIQLSTPGNVPVLLSKWRASLDSLLELKVKNCDFHLPSLL